MAEKYDLIKKQVEIFYNIIKDHYPVKKIFLYGSYAKNSETSESDIDLGVVIDSKDHRERIAITSDLFLYAVKINKKFEPKCIFVDEYNVHEKASIISEIINSGIEILSVA